MNIENLKIVLIVSNNTEMRSVWESFFQHKNCIVINETTADHAAQAARLTTPSLIILDLNLPHPKHISLCRELRALTRGALLLLASPANDEELFELHRAGADEILPTPVNPMLLLIKSTAWLMREEWMDIRTEPMSVFV